MADIKPALEKLFNLEFKDATNALHKNKGENGLTYKGIYQSANPEWEGWKYITYILDFLNYYKLEESLTRLDKNIPDNIDIIKQLEKQMSGILEYISTELFNNNKLDEQTIELYYDRYWKPYHLDDLTSQNTAEEIFIFGVNAGMRTAIKKAQKLVGVEDDGIVGKKTIEALNSYDSDLFNMRFDEEEIKHYESLIAHKPSFARFKAGWKNRAHYV